MKRIGLAAIAIVVVAIVGGTASAPAGNVSSYDGASWYGKFLAVSGQQPIACSSNSGSLGQIAYGSNVDASHECGSQSETSIAINPANPHLHGRYRPWRAYGQAKLANFHFGLGLQRELENAGASTVSLIAHPGLSNTDLQAVSVQQTGGGTSQRFWLFLARRSGMSAADGALSQLRAATDPAAKGGEFYGPLFVNSGPPVRKPVVRRLGMDKAIVALWEVSERETGIAIDVRAAAAA